MMAAAYAALLSLSNILHQILNPPPTHHFKFPIESVQPLGDEISSLIEFLETSPNRRNQRIEDLEERIVGAVNEAEDIVESYVVRKILVKYATRPRMRRLALFRRSIKMVIREFLPIQKVSKKRDLQKVIEDFISIGKELAEIKNREGVEDVVLEISTRLSSSTSLPAGKNIMVGFDKDLDQVRGALASDESDLLILPIVGMGGIGKTTLALNVILDPYITENFEIRDWVSVSQEYTDLEVVMALLQQINSKIDLKEMSVDDLGVLLLKELFRKAYLIVLDDMWEIQPWENLKKFLPDLLLL